MSDFRNSGGFCRAIAVAVVTVLWAAAPLSLHAAGDCPSAVTGKGSFVLARDQISETEVLYDDSPVLRATLRYKRGRVLLERVLYQGLFELDRVDRGKKFEVKAKTELAKFFPLKPKRAITADFDVVTGEKAPKTKSVRLQYLGAQDYSIGECTYSVLKFRRDERWPVFYGNIDYYAPELRFVVAKEYPESNGKTTIIGYTTISSVKQ